LVFWYNRGIAGVICYGLCYGIEPEDEQLVLSLSVIDWVAADP
jgi:hypothetical protein